MSKDNITIGHLDGDEEVGIRPSPSAKVLTEEQLARIEENRQRALAKRKQAESLRQIDAIEEDCVLLAATEQEAKKHISETSSCQELLNDGSVCGKCPVDHDLCEYFGEFVCKSCKYRLGETYKTISRSDAISQFLVPEESIKSLQFMSKANPHNPGWTQMKLYLRKHVISLALERFGSLDALEIERKKREMVKFEKSLAKTDDILAKQSAIFRDTLKKELDCNSPPIDPSSNTSLSDKQVGIKRNSSQSNSAKGNLNAKRKRMVSDFLSCLK